jgi:hypothetical protein
MHIRNDHKQPFINRKRLVDKNQTDRIANIRGLWAEIAVAYLYDTTIDETQRPGGDHGIDLYIDGRTVQVKYNTYYYGDLYFNSLDEFVCELAFLVVPGGRRDGLVYVVGWITREEFENIHTVKDYGYGDRVRVEQKHLHPGGLSRNHRNVSRELLTRPVPTR